jgi:hypothetical protein
MAQRLADIYRQLCATPRIPHEIALDRTAE